MKFTISHSRAFIGQNITVGVSVENNETMRHISIVLDGFSLREADPVSGSSEYTEEFSQVGEAGPDMEHELVVSVTDDDMKTHSSTTVWTDAS